MNKLKILEEINKYENLLKKVNCRDNYIDYVEHFHRGRWKR